MNDQTETTGFPAHRAAALRYEPEAFREYVQDMDLTPAQQDALLETVWLVVVGIIDIGLEANQGDGPISNPLAVDSSRVLALLSTSKTSNTEDARANRKPSAPRTDS